MQRYLLNRVLQSVLLMFGVLVIVFGMVRLTGDPASLMVAREAKVEQVEAFRESMGFNRPLSVQFIDFIGRAFVGDFGQSLRFNQPTIEIVLQRLPVTFRLASLSLMLAIIIAIPLGIVGGANPGSTADGLSRAVGLIGQVTPTYWLALVLILTFSVNWGVLPSFGIDGASSYVLPSVALAVGAMGQLVRLTRSAVLEIRSEDYIRTARSKGLSGPAIAARHIFRNAAIALISVISIQFTYLLGGSVYIESIFAIPGLGSLLDEAIRARDFPLVQTITIFIALFAISLNLLTDVAYALIDPRIRYK